MSVIELIELGCDLAIYYIIQLYVRFKTRRQVRHDKQANEKTSAVINDPTKGPAIDDSYEFTMPSRQLEADMARMNDRNKEIYDAYHVPYRERMRMRKGRHKNNVRDILLNM